MKASKALTALALGVAFLLAAACKPGPYLDGQYTGEGRGNADRIVVEVTVKGGYIADLAIMEQHETAGLFDAAYSGVKKEIIEKQRVEVEAVSGATHSSQGIMEAVAAALAKAKKQ